MNKLVALSGAMVVAAAWPAGAMTSASPAGLTRSANADITMPGTGGLAHVLSVRAVSSSAGSWLEVQAETCTGSSCTVDNRYRADLPEGAFTVSATTGDATLKTTIADLPLDIRWTDTGGVAVGGGELASNAAPTSADGFVGLGGQAGDVHVILGSATCDGSGDVDNSLDYVVGGTSELTLSELAFARPGTITCIAPDTIST